MSTEMVFDAVSQDLDIKISKILLDVGFEKNCLIVKNGYFVSLKKQLNEKSKNILIKQNQKLSYSLEIIDFSILNKNEPIGMITGRLKSKDIINSDRKVILDYTNVFLKGLMECYQRFLEGLIKHFRIRKIGDEVMINNDYIRQEIAEIIALFESISFVYDSDNYCNHIIRFKRLIELGRLSIKLLGGRSLQENSILDVYLGSMLIMNTYLR